MKPKLIAGKGRDRHFLSAWNPPDVRGRCFVCFTSCKPPKGSVWNRAFFLFSGQGSQESKKIRGLLRVTKSGGHRSEANPEVISCPQTGQTQGPELCQPGRPLGGLEPAAAAPALCLHGLAEE